MNSHTRYSRAEMSRRRVLQSASALAGAGFLGSTATQLLAATFEEVGSQWMSADIDWRSQEGSTIVLNAVQHPWTDAITPLVPLFTELTGINVDVQTQSETEYTAELPVKLGAGNPTPDVYMVWAIGQAITAGWLEPLDGFYREQRAPATLPGGMTATCFRPHGPSRPGLMASAT